MVTLSTAMMMLAIRSHCDVDAICLLMRLQMHQCCTMVEGFRDRRGYKSSQRVVITAVMCTSF